MKRKRVLSGLLILLGASPGASVWAQVGVVDAREMRTRPEHTDYRETSSYADVLDFVQRLAAASPRVQLTTFGYSSEGRALPLVVVGDVEDAGAEAVKASGKLRVFIQGNIHAGEVCGKEAALMLLRALANGEHAAWLDSLVLLVAPIYNADGNERVELDNRPLQNGPIGGMGQRGNAAGLDLNRDHMKIDSPEARSLIGLMNDYDPYVLMDLHTTNGSHHGYRLTYAPPLHPSTDEGVVELLRGDWLPEVTESLKRKYGWDYYYYGFLPWRSMGDVERGWYTFSHQPRFNTNYIGVRNRIGILSEAYAYATFEDRILATLRFVEEVVDYAYRHASEIVETIAAADAESIVGVEVALRAEHRRSEGPIEILMGEVARERHPYTGEPVLRRLDVRRVERMPEFGTFRPTETALAPAAYLVPEALESVLNLLTDHGIRWERLASPRRTRVERFALDSMRVAEREYQGHFQLTLFGVYEEVETEVPEGTVVVPVGQPLGRLAVLLLEPRSDDGLANWNLLGEALDGAGFYPIQRVGSLP